MYKAKEEPSLGIAPLGIYEPIWTQVPSFTLEKLKVHTAAVEHAQAQVDRLQATHKSQQLDLTSATKSSAGDKHETTRAMIQLEIEKLGVQLKRAEDKLKQLQRHDPAQACDRVQTGALVQVDRMWLYVSVALGEIEVEDQDIQCVGADAPLIRAARGCQAGDTFVFKGKRREVIVVL